MERVYNKEKNCEKSSKSTLILLVCQYVNSVMVYYVKLEIKTTKS